MKKKFLAAVMALVMIGTTPVGVFADTMVKSYLTGLDVPESEGRVDVYKRQLQHSDRL